MTELILILIGISAAGAVILWLLVRVMAAFGQQL